MVQAARKLQRHPAAFLKLLVSYPNQQNGHIDPLNRVLNTQLLPFHFEDIAGPSVSSRTRELQKRIAPTFTKVPGSATILASSNT